MCDTISLDGQENLGSGMLAAAARAAGEDNAYRTGLRVIVGGDSSLLDRAIDADEFKCAAGYELDTVTPIKFMCNYPTSAGGAATFDGQLCTPVDCAVSCTPADDSAECAWCAFIQAGAGRASGVDCSNTDESRADAEKFRQEVWCQCLQSTASRLGVSDVSLHADADWLSDGQCHPMFDSGMCHRDGGDCGGVHTSACEAQIQDVIRPACCSSVECSPVPDTVTESCARLMVPFWKRCAYEAELPYLPMWVWGGLAAYSETKLGLVSGYCASQPAVSFSTRQRCDAHCDCGMLDPNDPDSCSDEQIDSHGDPCEYPDAPTTSFCGPPSAIRDSDKICTCNSGEQIPFEWLCDGSNDCGMGEDETASACGETGASDLVVWGETFPVTGARKSCIRRWTVEVASACLGLHIDGAGASSCEPACAATYLDWYLDCKHITFNENRTAAHQIIYENGANDFFLCCLDAQTTGAEQECTAVAGTLQSCDADVGPESLAKLGDKVCQPALDCEAYLEDAGDCALVVTATQEFEVTGTFSANDFVAALATPHRFLQRSDISVQRYEQNVNAELNLGCNFDGAVNAALLTSPAGEAQLVSGIANWLGIQETLVTIDDVISSSVAGNEVVLVHYAVTRAPKDVSEKYIDSSTRESLLGFLDEAHPQAIPIDMSSCGTHFTAAAPAPAPEVVTDPTSVTTTIVVKVEIVETEYELAEGPLAGTESERLESMTAAIEAALQDEETILRNLNIAAECIDCVTVVRPGQVEVETYTPPGKVIAEFSESELALAVAVIIVLVLGGCVCCLTLCACTWYWYKRKQKRQVLLIDQAGNILKEWEDEADSAEREVLMSVLHHYIEEQDKATKAAQEREEEELIATLEAYEVIEDAIIAEPVEEGDDLIAAANAEAQAAKKERDAKRKKAQERLAKRRAALLEKKKEAMKAAGVDEEDAEAIVSEIAAAESEADQHRAELESTLDNKQIDEESSRRAELQAKLAAASTDEERAALEAAYKADVDKMRADMDAERSRQRAALDERLKRRKAAVQANMDAKLEGKNVEEMSQIEEEQAQIEEEAAAEIVDDETCQQLSAAFEKDGAQLKATRDAKKAAAQAKLEERRKAMAAKHKRELLDAGTPPEVAEKQMKELDDLAALEAKQLEQQNNVMKKKEAAALEALEAKRAAEAEKAEDEQARAEIVTLTLPHHLSVAMLALQ